MSGSEPDTPNTQEPIVNIKKQHETCTNIKLEKHSIVHCTLLWVI